MSTEENKAIIQRVTEEVYNKRNLAVADEINATNVIVHFPNIEVKGIEAYKKLVSEMFNAFPDLYSANDEVLAEGDTVAARYTMIGTHKGEFMGIAPTGKKVTMTGMSIAHFTEGKITESWGIMDTMGMLQQLGVMPKQ
jgi:steroid delta-isomerase-like uncharacterized protein